MTNEKHADKINNIEIKCERETIRLCNCFDEPDIKKLISELDKLKQTYKNVDKILDELDEIIFDL
jgi:hypothetical protein